MVRLLSNVVLSPKEEKEIKEKVRDMENPIDKYAELIAPNLIGILEKKKAILMGLASLYDDGERRWRINSLLHGPAGTGKCLDGSERIMLPRGDFKKIKDIVEPHINGEEGKEKDKRELLGLDGLESSKKKSICVSKRKYSGDMYTIKSENGREINVTKKHPLFVREGLDIKVKKAYEIEEGDEVILINKTLSGSKQELPDINLDCRAKDINIPDYTSPGLLEFIGYYLSEGYMHNAVIISNKNNELRNRIKKLYSRVFNDVINTYSGILHTTIGVKQLFEKIGLRSGSKNKNIPNLLKRTTDDEVASLLRGLFDGDGFVSKKSRNITITSKSEELIDDIQDCLLRFSIYSVKRIAKKKISNWDEKKKYYRLYIGGYKNLQKFYKKIGFNHPKKKDRLKKWVNKEKMYSDTSNIVQGLGKYLLKVRKMLNIACPREGYFSSHTTKIKNKDSIRDLLEIFEDRIEEIRNIEIPEDIYKFWKEAEKLKTKANLYYDDIGNSTTKYYIQMDGSKRKKLIDSIFLYEKFKDGDVGRERIIDKKTQATYINWKNNNSSPNKKIMDNFNTAKDNMVREVNKLKGNTYKAENIIRKIRDLINLDLIFNEVKECQKKTVTDKTVYDIQMEEEPLFIVNGIVSHNSKILTWLRDKLDVGFAGKKSTEAGLVGSMSHGKPSKGKLPKNNMGILAIDELDKMSKTDRDGLLEAMSDGSVTLTGGNVDKEFKANTIIVAAANHMDQLNEKILSRFDFKIYFGRYDRNTGERILESWGENNSDGEKLKELQKYLKAVRGFKPKKDVTPGFKMIRKLWDMHNISEIVPREHIERFNRVALAHARLNFRNPTKVDFWKAIEILMQDSYPEMRRYL